MTEKCGAQYGANPDLCNREAGHKGAHSNQYGTTWVTGTARGWER